MTGDDPLGLALAELVSPSRSSIWDRLQNEAGYGSGPGGRRARASQPPIKLSVVSLVMDVTVAAREGADDLARRVAHDTPSNLWLVQQALLRRPDTDLTDWWVTAIFDWTARARAVLAPNLLERLYGAACPYCGQSWVSVNQDGEIVRIPTIEVTWDEYSVRDVECRLCGAHWVRDQNLSELFDHTMRGNLQVETLAR